MFSAPYDSSHLPYMAGVRSNGRRKRFDEYLRCYPIAMMPEGERKAHFNYGGKIFLPSSALEKLSRLHVAYPMLFELRNGAKGKVTHAGVLEFTAEEGRAYLPYWMMQTLALDPGDLLNLKSTDLSSGSFIKLQPHSVSFINNISDPKAVLENVLRSFSAMTQGDVFQFSYNEENYEIEVLEVKPENTMNAISCVETDLSVDFAAPKDYVEPERTPVSGTPGSTRPGSVLGSGEEGSMARNIGYAAIAPGSASALKSVFSGTGQRLKASKNSPSTSKPGTPVPAAAPAGPVRRGDGPQPLRLQQGKLFFGFEVKPVRKEGEEDAKPPTTYFEGAGQTLRAGKRRKGDDSEGKGKGKEVVEID